MSASILTKTKKIVTINAGIYGSNRLRHNPYINHCCGAEINHSNGKLKKQSIETITYDVNEKFPEDKIAQLFSAGSSELAQVTASSDSFQFTINPLLTEFVVQTAEDTATTNVSAGILNSLLKQWDKAAYIGSANVGITNNPKLVTTAAQAVTDLPSLLAAFDVAGVELKNLGLRQSDFSSVSIGYTSGLSSVFNGNFGASLKPNAEIINAKFGGGSDEIPTFCSGAGKYIELYYRPMITLHHGVIPSLYSTEDGAHKLTISNLFAMETCAVEIEERGAIVRIPVS